VTNRQTEIPYQYCASVCWRVIKKNQLITGYLNVQFDRMVDGWEVKSPEGTIHLMNIGERLLNLYAGMLGFNVPLDTV